MRKCSCKLLVLLSYIAVLVGCDSTEYVAVIDDIVLRREKGNEKFELCQRDGNGFHKVSEKSFDGEFEVLNLDNVSFGDHMYAIVSEGKRYLYCGSQVLLDGDPFIRYKNDNALGVYFETAKGKYYNAGFTSAPSPVDDYYRTGTENDTFIYEKDGKCGAYIRYLRLLPHRDAISTKRDGYKYVQVLPLEYDKIRFVRGNGANHFVVKKGGKISIIDVYGRKRLMNQINDEYQLNTYYPYVEPRYRPITGQYIRNVFAIPVNRENYYSSYFRDECTCKGNDHIAVVLLKEQDKYQRFFSPGSDGSTFDLSWDSGGDKTLFYQPYQL